MQNQDVTEEPNKGFVNEEIPAQDPKQDTIVQESLDNSTKVLSGDKAGVPAAEAGHQAQQARKGVYIARAGHHQGGVRGPQQDLSRNAVSQQAVTEGQQAILGVHRASERQYQGVARGQQRYQKPIPFVAGGHKVGEGRQEGSARGHFGVQKSFVAGQQYSGEVHQGGAEHHLNTVDHQDWARGCIAVAGPQQVREGGQQAIGGESARASSTPLLRSPEASFTTSKAVSATTLSSPPLDTLGGHEEVKQFFRVKVQYVENLSGMTFIT